MLLECHEVGLGEVVIAGNRHRRHTRGERGEELLVLGRVTVVCEVTTHEETVDDGEVSELGQDSPQPVKTAT